MEIVEKIIEVISKTKATNVCKIDISKTSSLADYFVIATGSSSTSVNAIADFIEVELKKFGVMPLRRNGRLGESWVVVDYGNVICHFFDDETREFYNLEKLWGQSNNLTYIGGQN